jgi:hypothetical protein
LPGPEDDVYANARVIHIDGNFAAKRITNLSAVNIARRGGYFTIGDGFTLSAYVHGSLPNTSTAPWNACLQFLSASPASATLVGSLCAGDRVPGTVGGIDGIIGSHIPIALINFGNFTVIGNVEGGTTGWSGAFPDSVPFMGVVQNHGNLTVYGDVSATRIDSLAGGGNVHYGFVGIRNNGTGNVNVYGNVVGGVNFNNYAINGAGTGTIRVFGDITNRVVNNSQGARGILTNSTTSLFVSGVVYGGAVGAIYGDNYALQTLGTAQITGAVIGRNNSNAWFINSGNAFLLQGPNQPHAVVGSNASFNSTLYQNGGNLNVIGNIRGGGSVNYTIGLDQRGGNLTITGFVSGGAGQESHGMSRSGGTTTVYGNVRGGTGGSAHGINFVDGAGALTIYGDVSGGTGGGNGIGGGGNTATKTIIISGDVYASPINNSGVGYSDSNASGTVSDVVSIYGNVYGREGSPTFEGPLRVEAVNGTINIFGDVIVRSNTYAVIRVSGNNRTINITGSIRPSRPDLVPFTTGIRLEGTNITLNLTGDVIGGTAGGNGGSTGSGIDNAGSSNLCRINVLGTAKGGLGAPGITNAGSGGAGTVYAKRVQGNDAGPSFGSVYTARPGIQNSSATGRVFVEEVVFGSQGATPVSGPVFMVPKETNITVLNTGPTTGYTAVTLFRSINFPGFTPLERDVRQGIVYGGGEFTGTMIVPSRESVQFGVPVDNTRGLAALSPISVWNFSRNASLSAGSIGERVRNALTTQAAGSILASFNLSGVS